MSSNLSVVPAEAGTHSHRRSLLREVSIHTALIENNEPPSGVGEPGVPPIAPAVANALAAATGKRLRKLPLSLT